MTKLALVILFALFCLKITESREVEEWNTRVWELSQSWPCAKRQFMIHVNKTDNNPATGVIPDTLLIDFCSGYCPKGYSIASYKGNPSGHISKSKNKGRRNSNKRKNSMSKNPTFSDLVRPTGIIVRKPREAFIDLGDPESGDYDAIPPVDENSNGMSNAPPVINLNADQSNKLIRQGRSIQAPPDFFPEQCHPTATTDTFYVSAYKNFLTNDVVWKYRVTMSHFHCKCQYWD